MMTMVILNCDGSCMSGEIVRRMIMKMLTKNKKVETCY